MDLFDRYLQAVRSLLPKSLRDDVIRELSEELRSQVEEREAEFGRSLNQDEQEQILKQWGHPWLLASRYQPRQQLVGPSVFPFYWLVLKISLGIAVLVHVIASAVLLANGRPPAEVITRLATLPLGPLLVVFAWVTVVFAVLDRSVPRMPFITNWNPTSLPDVSDQSATPSLACRIGDVALATMFVLWLAAVPYNQWLIFGPAAAFIELAPVWLDVHVGLLAFACAGLAVSWLNLLNPHRVTFRLAAKLAGHIVSIFVFWFLVNAGVLVVPAASAAAGTEGVAAMVNTGMRIGFMVTAILSVVETVREARRLVRRLRVPRYSSF
jgi:hypothetical protein